MTTLPPAINPRAHRVPLLALHRVEFRVSHGIALPVLRLSNISTSGLGFLRDDQTVWPAAGSVIDGVLAFEETTHPVSAKLVHVSDRVAGATFIAPAPSLRELVNRYFKIELAAVSLLETPPEMLNEEPDGVPRWLHGQNNCELFFVVCDGVIIRFQLTVFGTFIEWLGEGKAPSFGQVNEDQREDGINYKGSAMIGRAETAREDLVRIAERFVQSIPHLGNAQKAFISANIRR